MATRTYDLYRAPGVLLEYVYDDVTGIAALVQGSNTTRYNVTVDVYPLRAFTAVASTDVCTSTAHGLANNAPVHVGNMGGALPGALNPSTQYYIRDSAANTFKLCTTPGGTAVNITSAGSGTNFLISDVPRSYLLPANQSAYSLSLVGAAQLTFTLDATKMPTNWPRAVAYNSPGQAP